MKTVSEALLRKWLPVFGSMESLHTDGGKEFDNEELIKVAEYLNVKKTTTAAYSPNQNGVNERNHAIVDRMMEKMMFQDKSLKLETALCWALSAKNSLENYQGFSPSQLVFGENPKFPSLYSAGPPGLEEVNVSKAAAMHINAMHSAREAFVECESERILKTALKQRIFARGENIQPGDWIYFKNKSRRWEGPVKVATKDNKLLYAVRGGRLLTINTDHAVLSVSKGEVVSSDSMDDSRETLEPTENENSSIKPSESAPSSDACSI